MKTRRMVFLFVSGCAIAALPFCAFVANSAQNDAESPEVSALAETLANDICVSAESMNRQGYARARKSHKDLKMFEETITRRLLAYVEVERDHRSFTEMEASVVGILAERPSIPVMRFCVSHLDYSAEMNATEIKLFGGYPCALALEQLGSRAVPHLIGYVTATNEELSDKYIRLAARLLGAIYSDVSNRHEVALSIVEERVKNTEGRKNLIKLRDQLESMLKVSVKM